MNEKKPLAENMPTNTKKQQLQTTDYPYGNLLLIIKGREADRTPVCTEPRLIAVVNFWNLEYKLADRSDWSIRHQAFNGDIHFILSQEQFLKILYGGTNIIGAGFDSGEKGNSETQAGR
jgi:hypothetical protein